jgi:hypothetical protein
MTKREGKIAGRPNAMETWVAGSSWNNTPRRGSTQGLRAERQNWNATGKRSWKPIRNPRANALPRALDVSSRGDRACSVRNHPGHRVHLAPDSSQCREVLDAVIIGGVSGATTPAKRVGKRQLGVARAQCHFLTANGTRISKASVHISLNAARTSACATMISMFYEDSLKTK